MIVAPARHAVQRELDQGERGEDVDAEDAREVVEGEVLQRRLGAGAEVAGVVDEQVDAVARGLDQLGAVGGVGDVAGDRDDLAQGAELGRGALQRAGAAGVDDQAPAVAGQGAREREAEAAGGAGDDGGGHGPHARCGPVPPTRRNWS